MLLDMHLEKLTNLLLNSWIQLEKARVLEEGLMSENVLDVILLNCGLDLIKVALEDQGVLISRSHGHAHGGLRA